MCPAFMGVDISLRLGEIAELDKKGISFKEPEFPSFFLTMMAFSLGFFLYDAHWPFFYLVPKGS